MQRQVERQGWNTWTARARFHVQTAEVVILAAFTVENVRVLMNSATSRYPDGLANGSGLLGRYVMTHSATNAYGLFDEDLHSYMGIATGDLYSQDRLPKFRGKSGFNGHRHWQFGIALKPGDVFGITMTRPELFGRDLAVFMKEAGRASPS